MQLSCGVPFDALDLDGQKRLGGPVRRMPSLSVIKNAARDFVVETMKETGEQQKLRKSDPRSSWTPSKRASVRNLIGRPKEKAAVTRESATVTSTATVPIAAAATAAPPTTTKGSATGTEKKMRRPARPTLRRSARHNAEHKSSNTCNNTFSSTPSPSETTLSPLSPRSNKTFNSNKPLPSPPPPGTIDKVDGRPPKPVLKLDRIMATLTDTEIEKLFSGAPQFFARSQGHKTGAPHPSVAFPWNEELTIRDLTDHVQIEDDAWGCVTASPRIILRDPLSATSPSVRTRPHFNAKCPERPNMLSMQGLEKGTMGYQAALEMSVSDALQEEQYGFDSLGSKAQVVIEQRQRLITNKDGLRHLDDAAIMEQLLKNEERYQADRGASRMKSHDLYNELFRKVLHPPTRVIDHNDPYSLAVQIHALVRVLAAPNAWIDFSRIEWRIRLGQMLWGFPLDDELSDGSSINEGKDAQERSEERYWLLLQILLSCELLIRLDAITEGDEFGAENLKASEIHRFEKEANISVKWSLILARTWLKNISITKVKTVVSEPSTPKGWLTNLTNKMSLKHEHMHGAHYTDHTQHLQNMQPEHDYAIKGKYNERQVAGLLHFARKLRWPGIQASMAKVTENAGALGEATPITSPLRTSDTQRSSYFGSERTSTDLSRNPSRRRKIEAALHASGWLSKSYISGLILPGEVLSHFLMSTLLENDDEAISRLGPMANLCGGFVYNGKSFWSTACVVGRVLAAGKGSAECMGWISSDVTPENLGEGWVNIVVDDIPDDLAKTGKKARIWGKTAIERESDVLGDADPSSVLPADFIIPSESNYAEPPPSNIRIELTSLNLFAPVDSVHSTPTTEKQTATPFSDYSRVTQDIHTYPASVAFSVSHDGLAEDEYVNLALSKDVYFVTAHPCVASSYVKYFKSPTSPTIQQIDVGGHDFGGNSKQPSTASIIGHPLHRFYTYTAIHLLDLLKDPTATLEDLLARGTGNTRGNSSNNSTTSSIPNRTPRVLVIDSITGFAPPRSPSTTGSGGAPLSRVSSLSSSSFGLEPAITSSPIQFSGPPAPENHSDGTRDDQIRPGTAASYERIDPPTAAAVAESKMRLPTRRRQFGSDLETLVRAVCAERGWNAVVSRRRRGCLACAIREAGALGWRVVIRVD
ncbi:hypothetical protein F4778DRAFT_761972 [Xylariomycetidae sp. FL2044]|nr:hypothetical protein F4778DRAFT_761972 [Xylariomycetidae sp. FL2044]